MCSEIEKKYTLKYEEELLPFMDVIDAMYVETSEDDVVFRSTLTDPPTKKDSTPQSKRMSDNGVEEEAIILTKEEADSLTEKEKRSFVGDLAISVFETREKCLKDIRNIVNHIAAKYSLDEAEAYLNEKRGPFMVKLKLSREVGLIEKEFNKKGHKNVLLNEGEFINDYVIETYPPMKLRDLLNEKNLNEYIKSDDESEVNNDTPER